MEKFTKYIKGASLAAMVAILAACNDNFETPPMVYPTTNLKANTTIADLKTKYWSTDRNYVNTVGLADNNEHVIIKGRVVSEDASGNIYNSIVLQDETGAINISVVQKNLTSAYKFGQEVLVDCTNLKIGGYNSLMQLGGEGTYNGAPSMTFMEATTFEEHAKANGIPNPAKVDTLTLSLNDIDAGRTNRDFLIANQSRLVRIPDVTFETPGQPWATDKNTDRYAKNADGKRINVRTSSYATFKEAKIPTGTGEVVGILSYYGSDWQVLLNDTTGIIGFTPYEGGEEPGIPSGSGDGTEAKPYTVAQIQAGATGTDVWTTGYIVGWVDGMNYAEGAKFTTPATVATNILIADTNDAKDAAKCIPVQLPTGDVRSKLNLQDNPSLLGKQVTLKATIESYFGQNGLKNTSAYKIEGGTPDEPQTPATPVVSIDENFDASTSVPAGWTQIQAAGNKSWYVTSYQNNNYIAMTGYKGTAPFDQYLLTPPVDMDKAETKNLSFRTQMNNYGSKTTVLEVLVIDNTDLAKATVKDKLTVTLATPTESGYSAWAESGTVDLSKYKGTVYIAFRYTATTDANYATWCVDNVKVNIK